MKLKNSLGFILLLFLACKQEKKGELIPKKEDSNYLIEFDEFEKISKKATTKIIDFRKQHLYQKEHIPNALNIWRSDIENKEFPYKGMMASKLQIEKLFSRLGIKNGDTLIIYDDNGLCDAARLWWILQNYDYINTKLLHGGFSGWKKNKKNTTSLTTKITPSVFKLKENSSMKFHLSKNTILKSLGNSKILIDTRTPDEYSGKRQKKGAFKGGRIPTSRLIDWATAINYTGDKKMKSKENLEKIYSTIIKSKNDTVFVYCHSGVRSAHTTFVLTQLLNYKNVKNYDGSWTEWSYFNDLPIEKDSITTIKN